LAARSWGSLRSWRALEREPLSGTIGIGHTRWATHGKPSVANSHPHVSCDGRIAVVHNGIIENYQELRAQLEAQGHTFTSQTDTEVMAHLVEKHFAGDLREAVCSAVAELHGAFAFGVIQRRRAGAACGGAPLLPARGRSRRGRELHRSDMGAIRKETDRVYVISDDDGGPAHARRRRADRPRRQPRAARGLRDPLARRPQPRRAPTSTSCTRRSTSSQTPSMPVWRAG